MYNNWYSPSTTGGSQFCSICQSYHFGWHKCKYWCSKCCRYHFDYEWCGNSCGCNHICTCDSNKIAELQKQIDKLLKEIQQLKKPKFSTQEFLDKRKRN